MVTSTLAKSNNLVPRSFCEAAKCASVARGVDSMDKQYLEMRVKTSDFWTLYQTLASPTMGFLRDAPASPTNGRLCMIVELAEKASEVYCECDSVCTRSLIQKHFEMVGQASELLDALEGLPHCELACLFSALVYIRHMFHQGDPSQPPVQTTDVVMEDGSVLPEPEVLLTLCEQLAVKLGVRPYLNLTNWILFNWTTDGEASYLHLVQHPEKLKMRFQWFRGAAGHTEQNFWRAFAISEVYAVPMYGAFGWLFEALAVGDEEMMVESLQTVGLVVQTLVATFKSHVKQDRINVSFFNQLQNTAHFGMASAGAGGFQLPFIMLLDALLGVGNFPTKTQQVWEENQHEVHRSFASFVDLVKERAPALRAVVIASSNPDLKKAFDGVVKAFTIWRATHRARAANWLETSSVTTGRDNEDMERDVKRTFQKEMDHMIIATKSRAILGASATTADVGQSQPKISCGTSPCLPCPKSLDSSMIVSCPFARAPLTL